MPEPTPPRSAPVIVAESSGAAEHRRRELAERVASTARLLAAAGLVEAFGHVSARLDDGGLLITPTSPLFEVTPEQIVHLDAHGDVVGPDGARPPLEVPLHAAIYRARPDVGAICRGHGPSMVAWGTSTEPLPLLHGLGAIAGTNIEVHPALELVTTARSGDAVAATLGDDHAVLMLANGGLAVGVDLLEAATRLWFTEERATVALAAPVSTPYSDPDAWARRLDHTGVELTRAVAWFAAHFAHTPPPDTAAQHDRSTP